MATSTYPNMGGAVGKSDVGTFIPAIWSDQIIAAYEKKLVLAQNVMKMSMVGKKGDTIHVPKPDRGVASAKAENTAVTIQNATTGELVVHIDKHYEYSRLIEDIVAKQAMASLMRFYTQDAGYALALKVENDLFELGKSLGDGNGSSWVHSRSFQINTSTGKLEAYDADGTADIGRFSDQALRDAIQVLDDSDVPMDNRVLIVPPSAKNDILGITRYTSTDFTTNRGAQTGLIGDLYGVPVYVSSNCPVIENGVKAGLLMDKDAFLLVEQLGIRTQTQYKQEYLAVLFTADRIYGTS
ncbi:MAG: phage major capsid protein, partial [Ignisphaera sp.]|nr:phage major capsid protein [Ignisphaera sp.]